MVSQVPLTTNEEFKAVVSSAKKAFQTWRYTPVTTRQRVMLKLQELIRRDIVSVMGLILDFLGLKKILLMDNHYVVFSG